MSYGTPYLETEAILAAQESDSTRVQELLRDMLPNERRALYRACETLQDAIDAMTP